MKEGRLFRLVMFLFLQLAGNIAVSAAVSTDSIAVDTVSKVRELEEVVVKTDNMSRYGNRESYVITKEMRKGSRTSGELLRKINGMDYNTFNEALTYLGSSNVKLLVDSLEKDASYIKRQSPERFDRIDIVTVPVGKYTGYDVLINFHSRPNYTGVEVNLRETMDVIPTENNGKGKNFASNYSYSDVTYMRDKLTLTALANWNWSNYGSSSYSSTDFPMSNYSETELERNRKDPKTFSYDNNLRVQLAGDYKINDRHTLSFAWQMKPSRSQININSNLNIEENGISEEVSLKNNNGTKGDLSNAIAAYYLGRAGAWQMDISASYTRLDWRAIYDLNRTDGFNLAYDRKDRVDYFANKADVNRWFGEYKWNIGFSNQFYVTDYKETDYDSGNVFNSNTMFNDYLYAQAQYVVKRNLSFTLNGGVSIFSNHSAGKVYTTVDPRLQAYVNWWPHNNFGLWASYLIHSGSPNISQLSENGQFVNKYIYSVGNPDLQTSLGNRATIRFTLLRKLTFMVDYMFTNGGIYKIYSLGKMIPTPDMPSEYFAYGTYRNCKNSSLTLSANYNQKLSKYFYVNANAEVMRTYASYENSSNSQWLPSGSMNGIFIYDPVGIKVGINYILSASGYVSPQSKQKLMTDRFTLGVQKDFLNDALNVALSWYAPLHIASGDLKYQLASPNMVMSGWGNNQFRRNNMLELTVIYRFTNGKQVRKVDPRIENADIGSQF